MGQIDTEVTPARPSDVPDKSRWAPMGSRHNTARVTTALLVAATLLGACSNHSPAPTITGTATTVPATSPSTPTADASPSIDPTVAAVAPALLDAYRGYWGVKVLMFADPPANLDGSSPHWNELRQFATDTAFADVFTNLHTFSRNGIGVVGAPVLSPTVTSVNGPNASIVDCVDSTNWQPVYTSTLKSAAAPGQSPRLVTNSTLLFYDGRWVVIDSVVDRERTC